MYGIDFTVGAMVRAEPGMGQGIEFASDKELIEVMAEHN